MASSLIKNVLDNRDLGDYRHASMLIATNAFQLAPKSKFNFHVVFSINKDVVKKSKGLTELVNKFSTEIGMLVKAIDLPKFLIHTETLNQYNRKKVVQIRSELSPVNIAFHDDNKGVIRRLWEEYYTYYYADFKSAKNQGANYSRSAMKSFDSNNGARYGLDNGSTVPFFTKITIYHMGVNIDIDPGGAPSAFHGWNSYTLINPVIGDWKHESLNHSIGHEMAENAVTIHYEAVEYDSNDKDPNKKIPGFATVAAPVFGQPSPQSRYDTTPSPLIKGH